MLHTITTPSKRINAALLKQEIIDAGYTVDSMEWRNGVLPQEDGVRDLVIETSATREQIITLLVAHVYHVENVAFTFIVHIEKPKTSKVTALRGALYDDGDDVCLLFRRVSNNKLYEARIPVIEVPED